MIKIKNRPPGFVHCMVIVFAATWLFACQAIPGLSGVGRVVPPEKRIPLLRDATHEGQWATRDLTLKYGYELTKNSLTVAGTVDFARFLQTGFETLDRFSLGMVLIDGAGTILASRSLLTLGYGRPIDQLTFKRDITLSPGTVAMTFGFSGRARGTGNIEWNFQKTPY